MQHVCIDARLYHATGIGTFLKAALASLTASTRYKLTLLCRRSEEEELLALGYDIIVMDVPIYTLREQMLYTKAIPPCALFWSPHFNVPLLPIRAKKRLVTVCDVYHLAHFSTLNTLQKGYAKLMYNAAFRLSDEVTTISEFSRKQIFDFATLKPKKVTMLPPGFDHFHPAPSSLPKQDYLLYVGNLKPHKNLVRLVQAYARLRPAEPLVIVGNQEGSYARQLMCEAEKDPFLKRNIQFTGPVSHERLQKLYAEAKLFIFPSTYEGFGYPPVEAMAYGCPVVAARAASIPEVCEGAAEYVDPFSVESIASGIGRLLADPLRCEELSAKGKELYAKKRGEKNRIAEVIDACCRGA